MRLFQQLIVFLDEEVLFVILAHFFNYAKYWVVKSIAQGKEALVERRRDDGFLAQLYRVHEQLLLDLDFFKGQLDENGVVVAG